MKRITLIALATAGLAFAATPSYAQSSYGGNNYGNNNYGNSSSSNTRSKARAERKAAQERRRAAKLEAERKALFDAEKRAKAAQSLGTSPSSATGQTVLKEEKPLLAKREDVLLGRTTPQLPTNCPEGTIAQSNGTCMLK